MTELRAPFPWFGGKRRVADVVWRAFGPNVPNYVEPFAGSLAVLLARPGGAGKIETVNDRDRFLANFWRAVTADPDAVARHADWPVNEADLHARHKWLANQAEFRERMHTDPDFFDVKIAGWWVWGICQWIGSGWCAEPNNHKHPKLDGIGKGVHSDQGHRDTSDWKQRPHLSTHSNGVHSERAHQGPADWRQLPNLRVESGASGSGVHASGFLARNDAEHRKRPELDGTSVGRGVHSEFARLPSLGNDRGLNGVAAAPCVAWFRALQERLRRVRVACGDWLRVLGPSVLGKGKNVGGRKPTAVFLDPPYSFDHRAANLYTEDDGTISAKVREWALEHGNDPDLRIALCGYAGEHEMPGWTEYSWKAARGYAAEGNENRQKERIWFSPHCLPLEPHKQGTLFDLGEAS